MVPSVGSTSILLAFSLPASASVELYYIIWKSDANGYLFPIGRQAEKYRWEGYVDAIVDFNNLQVCLGDNDYEIVYKVAAEHIVSIVSIYRSKGEEIIDVLTQTFPCK